MTFIAYTHNIYFILVTLIRKRTDILNPVAQPANTGLWNLSSKATSYKVADVRTYTTGSKGEKFKHVLYTNTNSNKETQKLISMTFILIFTAVRARMYVYHILILTLIPKRTDILNSVAQPANTGLWYLYECADVRTDSKGGKFKHALYTNTNTNTNTNINTNTNTSTGTSTSTNTGTNTGTGTSAGTGTGTSTGTSGGSGGDSSGGSSTSTSAGAGAGTNTNNILSDCMYVCTYAAVHCKLKNRRNREEKENNLQRFQIHGNNYNYTNKVNSQPLKLTRDLSFFCTTKTERVRIFFCNPIYIHKTNIVILTGRIQYMPRSTPFLHIL